MSRTEKSPRWRTSRRALMTAAGAAAAAGPLLGGAAMAAGPAADAGAVHASRGRRRAWVRRQLRKMSLEEKVGQLFMTHVYGETADTQDPAHVAENQAIHGVDNGVQAIERYHLGGVIYFAWTGSLENPRQIAELSNGLQGAAFQHKNKDVPLLIATDQEYGVVVRVGAPAAQFPGNMALGATGDADLARSAARVGGRELRSMGINQDFAPVADVNVNPANPVIGVRSFSSDPQLAAELTAAQVEGYQDGHTGVSSAAKHFPGHGDTADDSHVDLPIIHHTEEEWRELDAPPFAAAAAAGIDMVMTAHIQVPALDESLDPATLSHPILTGRLREELGFEGVVVTDSLRMAGVREMYPDEVIPVRALQAGVDLLLMPPDTQVAYDAVLAAVDSGELSEERIDESVERLLDLKYRRGVVANPFVDPDETEETVGAPEHLQTAQEVADASVTLVSNDGALPLSQGASVLVTGWGVTTTATVADKLGERGMNAEALVTGQFPTQGDIDAAVAAASGKDVVVVTTYNASSSTGQQQLIQALLDAGATVVATGMRNAYDIAYFTDVNAYTASYSWTSTALEALARTLVGEVDPSGTLPVSIPRADDPEQNLYELGHGLSY